ncbi:glycerol-3-phosphate acyltransferase 2, mitochondrial [Melopsittacus undulatus]|uniref:glycerol-3-phosphate acyltransferase 2, mitochondrial n=1 Tax=Melopsittacus undulatus TaxID=13146 RepID=UPI001469F845|nr:glycerol-3-phosphate acyltransferase 2, mitochondrial [Melopsittacus undulatus]
MDPAAGAFPSADPGGSRSGMRTWLCVSGQRVEVVLPFLGQCRLDVGRCCQTCTPMSWDRFYSKHLLSGGFCDVSRVTEKDTRFRGWLVRRVCGLLTVCSWRIPIDIHGELPARICRSARVQDAAPACDPTGNDGWKQKVLELLADIQAPLSLLLLRICHWALLKLLSRLFLSVQLHRGQLETVLRAQGTPHVPLVFLSTHKSHLDGPLLSFILCSRGLGVPRVTVGAQPCSPRLRSLLRRLGGVFLPAGMEQAQSHAEDALPEAVLAAYMEELLRSQEPLLIFLEEPAVPQLLSASARRWLALVLSSVCAGTVPDVLLVPVGIGYDIIPGGSQPCGAQPLGIGACLWAVVRALRRNLGCVRVDFGQPFSLQEFMAKSRGRATGNTEELLLLPSILGTWPSQLDAGNTTDGAPGSTKGTCLETPEEMLVTNLGLHSLSDSISCSAIMSVGITAALLLHWHREGVFLSRLLQDFAWLLEEILLRQRDVGFSGQLRVLVQHSLILLGDRLRLYHIPPLGDVLVIPEASAHTWMELGQHSADILPVFASEAVGACAIRALLAEMLPFLELPPRASSIIFSQDELQRKTLELLQLLPPNLLGLRPCQPLGCWSEDIVDKLILCGLLEPEQPDGEHWVCDTAPRGFNQHQAQAWMDFSDSESQDESRPYRCFKLGEPQGSPHLLLFLCRLLSPILGTYTRAVAYLGQSRWPQPEAAYVEELLLFLTKEGSELANRSLALSSLQTFKEMGVLEEVGSLLHLAQPFRSSANRDRLEAFIQQFMQP